MAHRRSDAFVCGSGGGDWQAARGVVRSDLTGMALGHVLLGLPAVPGAWLCHAPGRLVCGYAFAELEVTLIELHIAADNTASRRVARRGRFDEHPDQRGKENSTQTRCSTCAPSMTVR